MNVMKKGFTLAELMAVIVIMAILALIIIPTVDKDLKEGKEKLYNKSIETIESALDLFMTNYNLNNNESIKLSLYQLKELGYLDPEIKNPNTKDYFFNDSIITISKLDDKISYDISIEGTNIRKYENLPIIDITAVDIVELGSEYEIKEVTSKFNDTYIMTTHTGTVDTNTVGSYFIKYEVEHENYVNFSYKTVLVRDTTPPTVTFNKLSIPYDSINSYDFKSDINASDLSGIKNIEVITNFGPIKGDYSVKYIVTDNYDNETIKYRTVTVY